MPADPSNIGGIWQSWKKLLECFQKDFLKNLLKSAREIFIHTHKNARDFFVFWPLISLLPNVILWMYELKTS